MSEESSNPFLGKPISLVTKAGMRYEGNLYTVVTDEAEPSVTLSGVRVRSSTGDASASEKVFAFVTFKTSDIEDITVLENSNATCAPAAPEPAPASVQAPQQLETSGRLDASSGNRGARGGRRVEGRNGGPAWHEQPHPNPNPYKQQQSRQPQPQPQPQHSPPPRRAPRNGQFSVSADVGQIEALKSQLGEFNFEESNSKFAGAAAAPAVDDVRPVYVKDDFFDCLSAPAKSEERGRNPQQRQVDIDTFGEEALANRPRGAPRRGGGGNGRRGGRGGRGGQHQQFQ